MLSRSVPAGLACLAVSAAVAAAQSTAVYTTGLTQLMRGALVGQNVTTPVPGASLLLMKDGQVFYHQAFGQATLNEVHAADSASKTISGAVILSAVDESVTPFSLDSRLSDFLPEFTGPKAPITIRQAFSHTSGLPGSEVAGALTNPNITLRQAATLIAGGLMPYQPAGSTFAYGGVSMHAAGAAAEVATGIPFARLSRERLFDRVGMPDTRFYIASEQNPRLSGGIESTAPDFARFMEMLRRGGVTPDGTRVLAQASVDALFARQTDPGVTVFATDLTDAQNILPLLELIRDEAAARAAAPALAGDADLDRTVDVGDFARLAVNFNRVERVWEQGDFTGDGQTDLTDFALLAANFNQSLPLGRAGTVPEPGAATVVGLAALAGARRRRGAGLESPGAARDDRRRAHGTSPGD
jgi:hypothetical protein